MAWNAVAYVLPPGESCGKVINLSRMNSSDFQYFDGEYRIVMKIGNYLVKAEFEMGESDITPETPFGYQPLEKLPEDYSLEMAVENGDVVFSFTKSYNLDRLKDFAEKTQLGLPAMVRLVSFTVEGDPIIYDICRNVICGGADYYTLIEDTSRDQWGIGEIEKGRYSYLVTDGKDIYLSNYASFRKDIPDFSRDNRLITRGLDLNGKGKDAELYREILTCVEDLTKKRLEGNSTRLRCISPDGSWYVSLDAEQIKGGTGFGYGKEGYGSDCVIPEAIQGEEGEGSITAITGFQWIDEESVLLICDTNVEDKICNIAFWPQAAMNREQAFGEREYKSRYIQD